MWTAYLIGTMSLLVALQYAVLGGYFIPRLSRVAKGKPGRMIRTAQWGGTLFFFGCAATHVGIAVHVLDQNTTEYQGAHALIHIIPHAAQIAGGFAFIYIVNRYLDIRVSPKNWQAAAEEREQLLARLEYLATHDELTGLLNRRAFDDAFHAHQRYKARYGASGGVLFMDLDGFKQANDRYGHKRGDEILRKVADVLRDSVRATDVIGRMGGDEFAILLREAGPVECAGTAERIVAATKRAFRDSHTPITMSVGVAPCIKHDAPLEAADTAMYVAKRAGGSRYEVAA